MKIVFATNNFNKLKEVREIAGKDYEILSLKDINCVDDIPETGNTFEENAIQKAEYIREKYGYNCFSDDSGLETEALDGQPGVYSARYAGTRNDNDNINKLLKNLEGQNNRNAQFHAVIAYAENEKISIFEGIIKGTITPEPRGNKGFGYDPIFIPAGFNQTFGQLDEEIKNGISHRACAMTKFIKYLKNNR